MFRVILAAVTLAAALSQAGCRADGARAGADGDAAARQRRPTGAAAFRRQTYVGARGERMRYLLFEPADYDRRRKYPLVLWLHGGGSRGEDLDLILAHGDKHGPLFLARPDQQKNYPAFVVAPQCPAGRFWADTDADQPSEEMRLVLELLDRLRAEHSIDERRLYVLGISMGGYAAWDIITRRPGMFAAAVPICGGGAESRAGLMTGTAVWAFHGDRDEAVNVSQSRRMVAALKKAGAAPRYTEYEGVGHNSWEHAFAEPDLLPWLFAQRRK